ncbi:MAG: leucyl aminopeptidase [Solirubrobacteraceae bacterium]|jgi:leucyl aminopeptidase|nr:leucyl aminopeptidase [Solirubrobacteraceae bacterium]
MNVSATTSAPLETAADTIVIGVFEGKNVAHDIDDGALQSLLESGEGKRTFKHLALTHAAGKRWLLVGLGKRDDFDAERARVLAALAAQRASEFGCKSLCWEVPHHVGDDVAGALVEGTMLVTYRFDSYKAVPELEEDRPPPPLDALILSAHNEIAGPVARAAVIGEAVNAARTLQNTPSNDLTPTRLGERARELAAECDGLVAAVDGRLEIIGLGMGSFAAVAKGTDEEPALITLRYDGPGATGPVLGFVGKAVTFDTGGISLKPGAAMSEMKFDMSGGAAVLEAVGAIARLRLPIHLVAVIGATENMPSGHASKPGDIVRAMNGTTIEINNTDAEGRLVLADCLAHAVALGAERLVDLATLTGAIIIGLGSTYAGMMSNDDDWAATVEAAGTATGELVWRMPFHPEYADLIKGKYADLDNAPEGRKAGSITAAEFLKRFVGETPWVHLDIAGTAWNLGRGYAETGGSGFGVRLLVELASSHSG